MKSKTYTQSKRASNKNQSSKFCQSGVKQTHFQNLKKKKEVTFLHLRTDFKLECHRIYFVKLILNRPEQVKRIEMSAILPYLIRILVEIKEFQEISNKFAVEEVMSGIYCSQTPVRIICSVWTKAESSSCIKRI